VERGDPLALARPSLGFSNRSRRAAGLVGGFGVAPGANIGENAAIFEAVHGQTGTYVGRILKGEKPADRFGDFIRRFQLRIS
jgi:Isocitrate/isopropylmalate dehydrogenase